jgi:hypothetical protein
MVIAVIMGTAVLPDSTAALDTTAITIVGIIMATHTVVTIAARTPNEQLE